MKTRGIPFKGWKAAWIADLEKGKEFQTRRVIKPQPKKIIEPEEGFVHIDSDSYLCGRQRILCGHPASPDVDVKVYRFPNNDSPIKCPFGGPGARLYVKEAYRFSAHVDMYKPSELDPYRFLRFPTPRDFPEAHYEADGDPPDWAGRYRHARFMPRWVARSLLAIIEVRAERVQAISVEDCIAEGIRHWHGKTNMQGGLLPPAVHTFKTIWDSMYAGTESAWIHNPWVWVLRLRKE